MNPWSASSGASVSASNSSTVIGSIDQSLLGVTKTLIDPHMREPNGCSARHDYRQQMSIFGLWSFFRLAMRRHDDRTLCGVNTLEESDVDDDLAVCVPAPLAGSRLDGNRLSDAGSVEQVCAGLHCSRIVFILRG